MNEFRWLNSTDAHELLDYLFPLASLHSIPELPRKLRLYYVALTRQRAQLPAVGEGLLRIAEEIADGLLPPVPKFDRLYELAEQLAESGGEGAQARVVACEHVMRELTFDWPRDHAAVPAQWAQPRWSPSDSRPLVLAFQQRVPPANQLTRNQHDPDLLREIYGNPFQVIVPLEEWLTETVKGIARKCYSTGDFLGLTPLVDALQEAGFPSDHPMVEHCRNVPTGQHARGCWVVDSLLGL